MGTRADFYLGRGKDAQWLGSIAYDGYPDGLPDAVVTSTTGEEFKARVQGLMTKSHATSPDKGWPWPWETSHTTDYAYAWDDGVWISCFGYAWKRERDKKVCKGTKMPADAFPNMKELQDVALDGRSGMMILWL